MCRFHTREYIDFLLKISPPTMSRLRTGMQRHNVGRIGEHDCPVFDGLLPHCQETYKPNVGAATACS